MTAWATVEKPWQKLCEGLYIFTTLIAAIILFWVINTALSNTAVSNNHSGKTSVPSTVPAIGFICNPNAPSPDSNDQDEEDNKCSPAVTKHAAATVSTAAPPIKQFYPLLGSGLLLFGGVILLFGRGISMRGTASMASAAADFATAIIPAAELVIGQLAGLEGAPAPTLPAAPKAAQNQEHAQTSAVAPTPVSEIVANTSASTHPHAADAVLATTPVPRAEATPAMIIATTAEPVVSAKPSSTLVTATEPILPPSPDNAETKQLRESLLALQDRMSKHEQIVSQLQVSTSIPTNTHSPVAAAMPESRAETVPTISSTPTMEPVTLTGQVVSAQLTSALVSTRGYQRRKYY